MKGQSAAAAPGSTLVFNMTNTFQYQVAKPRRALPFNGSCVKPQFQNTVRSSVWEAYILQRARRFKDGFCFRDFLEMDYDSFRRIVRRLKAKGEIVPIPVKTQPQFYVLKEYWETQKP